MNIKEAKMQIKNAMTAYFCKDEYGYYSIPIEKQRPVFLMGPPGIGKTAIMEQIASELDVGLVSYSMTHHTRQSALGLPFIEKKTYGGKEYSVSEYTMSEIIASVYEMIEKSGKKEGILFLDEINCVSETLAPAMLQFLQYKIFGCHRVPEGWIVVTAGNPPEYNNSVREFDIVTWDRLKRIDVDPDYGVWKEYAYKRGVHASIITYLDLNKDEFYKIETTVNGKVFVTARGWSDLSDMIILYEKNNLVIDEKLVGQYLQDPKTAKNFAIYYDLYKKYQSDYQIGDILAGKASEEIKRRATEAKFDERLCLLGLLLDGTTGVIRKTNTSEAVGRILLKEISGLKMSIHPNDDMASVFDECIQRIQKKIEIGKMSSTMAADDIQANHGAIAELRRIGGLFAEKPVTDVKEALKLIAGEYEAFVKNIKTASVDGKKCLSNMIRFCEEVYGLGQEMVILITELTQNYHSATFISKYGCDEYFAHNKALLFHERHQDIERELSLLDLETE